eukprot:gnl/MRDRNA2_/MRDRNA2_24772_c0_seq1.p1 gnl/MRDRNA2_/MRDRNA2_24772_c0~~gnl/MRDRNA2_/MRDRNA2_24772_c0_seq1.p1  ORF type:complete len:286 (-),score=50.96 gnl/MRDRNA2_/MRDRNA2_24772_c0_seq1:61-897(-)
MAAMHSCSPQGAQIGVVSEQTLPRLQNIPEGNHVYEIQAQGFDGFIFMCFDTVILPPVDAVQAKLDVYVVQAGWHEEADMVKVWVEVDDRSSITMLPECAADLNKENIDVLGLRHSRRPGVPYTDFPGGADDPALLLDSWRWVTLVAELGAVHTARVCAGLQSGAGAEGMYIDNMRLSRSLATNTTPCALTQVMSYDSLASCADMSVGNHKDNWPYVFVAVVAVVFITCSLCLMFLVRGWSTQSPRAEVSQESEMGTHQYGRFEDGEETRSEFQRNSV